MNRSRIVLLAGLAAMFLLPITRPLAHAGQAPPRAEEARHGVLIGEVAAVETGEPLRKARVRLTDAANPRKTFTSTADVMGLFRFPDLPVGRYRLSVQAEDGAWSETCPEAEVDVAGWEPTRLALVMSAHGRLAAARQASPSGAAPLTAFLFPPMAFLSPAGSVATGPGRAYQSYEPCLP